MTLEGFDETSPPLPPPSSVVYGDTVGAPVPPPSSLPPPPIDVVVAASYCIAAEGSLAAARYALEGGCADRDAIVGLISTAISALNVALYATHGKGVAEMLPMFHRDP